MAYINTHTSDIQIVIRNSECHRELLAQGYAVIRQDGAYVIMGKD